jgi:hypothetical protein
MDVDFYAEGYVPTRHQQSSADVVGLIVPGGPVRTDFVPVDPSGTKFALTLNSPGDLPSPVASTGELVCFLVPNAHIPPNHGILLYWQLSLQNTPNSATGFELLGCLTPDRPSEIFRTGWSEHDQFLGLTHGQPATITIGLSMECLESVNNLASGSSTAASHARRPLVAQKIAQDLFNFMQSFDTAGMNGEEEMLVPQNLFERWWKRFETKSKRDPNFFLKSD